MNSFNFHPESGSTLWIQHLINGLSGLTIKAKHTVFCDSSPFQKIEVFDTYNYGLVLCLGGSIVMTERDSFIYHEMIVHPSMIIHPEPKRICVIGGGDGGCVKEILKHNLVSHVKVIEIDKMVTDTIEKFYPSLAEGFKDQRVDIVFDDGYHYLNVNDEKYDVIIVDSYDPAGPVQSLETNDFHRIVSQRLNENGIVVFQTDSPTVRKDYLRTTITSVSPLFSIYRPYICHISSFPDSICSFLMCSNFADLEKSFCENRWAEINEHCDYYNNEIHSGAFLLPQYIKNMIKI